MTDQPEAKGGLISAFRRSVQSEPGTAIASAVTLVTSIAGTVALAKLAGGVVLGVAVAAVGLYASVKVVKDALNCVRHKSVTPASSNDDAPRKPQATSTGSRTFSWKKLGV